MVGQICKKSCRKLKILGILFTSVLQQINDFYIVLDSAIFCFKVCQTLKRRPSDVLSLFEGADQSTIFHDAAHYFLTIYRIISSLIPLFDDKEDDNGDEDDDDDDSDDDGGNDSSSQARVCK